MELALKKPEPLGKVISPLRELGAYEALWDQQGTSFKKLAEIFNQNPGNSPSDFIADDIIEKYIQHVYKIFEKTELTTIGIRIKGAGEYPVKLRDAKYPIEVLYYQGWWDLVNSPCIAIVGTRTPSDEGLRRTRKLVLSLVKDGYTIVSGLARGIDTVAHSTAMDSGGRTIAVIGTPLSISYPKENAKLQELIRQNYLLISQVPFYRYSKQGPSVNKFFFPERNKVMSALTEGTVIIEAGETSGTLVQARAALEQGRKLFILDSCFRDPSLKWPKKYLEKGAIRIREYEDLRKHLVRTSHKD